MLVEFFLEPPNSSHGIRTADDNNNTNVAILGRRSVEASAGPVVDFRFGADRKLGCSNRAVPDPVCSASYVSFPFGSVANAVKPPSVT